MKRKLFNILSYVERIDISFEPLQTMRPRRVITVHAEVPSAYQKYLVEGSTVSFKEYKFGIVFSQKMRVRHQAFWLHVFDIRKSVTLKPLTNALLLCLNYMLRGRIECLANGQTITLQQGRYNFYALAKEIAYVAKLEKGLMINFHLTLPPDVIPEFFALYNDDNIFEKLFESGFKGEFSTDLLRISSTVRKSIEKILKQKVGDTAIENFLRDAARDEQLRFLFSRYIHDKNNAVADHKSSEEKLKEIQNLPAFIEQQLGDYHSGKNNPLYLHHVSGMLRMRPADFQTAVHKEFKCTWRELINRVRMQKASSLLKSKPLISVADISAILGYSYPTHFSRAFKLHYGQSPESHRDI